MYVAEFIPIGPGVICDIATMSVNIVSDIHPGSTTECSTRESIAYPPPKPKIPIFMYAQMSLRYIIVSLLSLGRVCEMTI